MDKDQLKKIVMLPAILCNIFALKLHHAEVGKNVVINGRLRLNGKGDLVVGDDVRINSCRRFNPIGGNTFTSLYIKQGACVILKDHAGLSNVAIYSNEKVEIGRYVKIGGNVSIYDTDFHSVNWENRRLYPDPDVQTEEVVIGDDVFVGAHSIILKGVKIGKRSVVAAGSVVTKSIPQDELWGGVPARFIKKLGGEG